jgi:hypothetical protein
MVKIQKFELMKSILYVFIRSYDTSYIRRNSKNKRICAAEHDTSTPTNDVNQDTKKHERLPTIEYLIIEVLIFHSGLLCLFFREKKIYYSDLRQSFALNQIYYYSSAFY